MRSSAAAEQFSNRGEKKNQEDPASRNKEMEDLSLTMSQSVLGAFGLRGPGEKRNDEKPSTQKGGVCHTVFTLPWQTRGWRSGHGRELRLLLVEVAAVVMAIA